MKVPFNQLPQNLATPGQDTECHHLGTASRHFCAPTGDRPTVPSAMNPLAHFGRFEGLHGQCHGIQMPCQTLRLECATLCLAPRVPLCRATEDFCAASGGSWVSSPLAGNAVHGSVLLCTHACFGEGIRDSRWQRVLRMLPGRPQQARTCPGPAALAGAASARPASTKGHVCPQCLHQQHHLALGVGPEETARGEAC